jgi:hypothetical protein
LFLFLLCCCRIAGSRLLPGYTCGIRWGRAVSHYPQHMVATGNTKDMAASKGGLICFTRSLLLPLKANSLLTPLFYLK